METVRAIPRELDPAVVSEIDERLAGVERGYKVRLGLAIESGSRAWGFPSPDSDYDCRFVYLRRRDDYLTLFPERDVIETPMTAVLDVNGWDLAKAVRLLLGGNAVIVEWLKSPIIYQAQPGFCADFLELAGRVGNRERFAHHYIHLARRILDKYFKDLGDVNLKKLFYVLRPALALKWLSCHPTEKIAPMNLSELMAGVELPADVAQCIEELLAQKLVAREVGRGAMPLLLNSFIGSELEAAETSFSVGNAPSDEDKSLADEFFRRAIDRYPPT